MTLMTSNKKIAFIDMLSPIVRTVCDERKISYTSGIVCVCQACVESGYGTSGIMVNANALFGIKATMGWILTATYGGLIYSCKTKECYDGKTYVTITDSFRAYHSIIDSVRDYFDLISLSRYSKSLTASSVKECITLIKEGGYATSPSYVNTVYSVYESLGKYISKYFSINPTSYDVIAQEVIAGKWGNGIERKLRLKQAGYDPTEVQKLVNKILKGG